MSWTRDSDMWKKNNWTWTRTWKQWTWCFTRTRQLPDLLQVGLFHTQSDLYTFYWNYVMGEFVAVMCVCRSASVRLSGGRVARQSTMSEWSDAVPRSILRMSPGYDSRQWRTQKFRIGWAGAEYNVSASSSFVANAHNELCACYA